MVIGKYKIKIERIEKPEELKESILDSLEVNAKKGLIQAKLEMRHHVLLLQDLTQQEQIVVDSSNESEQQREIRLTEEAIKRDKKSINNWETQLRAINYERNQK